MTDNPARLANSKPVAFMAEYRATKQRQALQIVLQDHFEDQQVREILEHFQFKRLGENKLGIQAAADFILSPTDREQLKNCLRVVYGQQIKLVVLTEENKHQSPRPWTEFRAALLQGLPDQTGQHVVKAWFDQLQRVEREERITLVGSVFFLNYISSHYEAAIEHAVSQTGYELELKFDANDRATIIYQAN